MWDQDPEYCWCLLKLRLSCLWNMWKSVFEGKQWISELNPRSEIRKNRKKEKNKRKRENNFRVKNIITEFLKNKSEIKSPKICFLDNQESGKLSEHLFKGEMATEPTREEHHCNFPRQGLPQTPALPVLLFPDQSSGVGTNVLSWEAWRGEHGLWGLLKPSGSALMTWIVHWQEAQANAMAPSPPPCVGRRDLPSRRNKGRTWDLLGVRPPEWWAICFCSTTASDFRWS